jgi:hypothetical protein
MLGRILESKSEGVTVAWRELHKELQNFEFSANVIITIKSRMSYGGHVVHMADLGIDGRTILKWMFRRRCMKM